MQYQKILLVGAGQLGSRYLQGIAKINEKFIIDVLDPSLESIERSKLRIQEISNTQIHKFEFKTKLSEINYSYDLAIISTTANHRCKVITDLSKLCKIEYWILEKNLAQSAEQIYKIADAIKDHKKAWVNTSFRAMNWHQKIKKEFADKALSPINMTVEGGDWGLACNAIHYIDLMSWWTNSEIKNVDNNFLTKWTNSKREGFKEVMGKIIFKYKDSSNLILICHDKFYKLPNIKIDSVVGDICIDEESGIATNAAGKIIKGGLSMQSEITSKIVLDILHKGTTELPNLKDSIKNHLLVTVSFLESWNKITNNNDELVKIT